MSKESFNWKSLFVNEEKSTITNPEIVNTPSSMPDSKFPETSHQAPVSNHTNNPFVAEVFDVYQKDILFFV